MISKEKGIIALDIDGTTADRSSPIPQETALYLKELAEKGWLIFFITGRTYTFANRGFKHLDFPFALAVQNGADIIEYPSKKLIYQNYIAKDLIDRIEPFYDSADFHYIIYSGFQRGDFCYYNRARFSEKWQNYLEALMGVSETPWIDIRSKNQIQDQIPLIKCFGDYGLLFRIASSLTNVNASIIKDTIDPDICILLITSSDANKGIALEHVAEIEHNKGPFIVCGDDRNDIPMLKRGDYRIVIEGAPEEVLSYADSIALPPQQLGVMHALKKVIDDSGNFTK